MPIDTINIDDLAHLCETHFASVKREQTPRALVLFDPADDSDGVMGNSPCPHRYSISGKVAILSLDHESLVGYLNKRARTLVPLGIVVYSGEQDIHFKEPEAPLGTLAVTTAMTNLQEARHTKKQYVLTPLAALAGQNL